MVIIERDCYFWNDQLSFFPSIQEIEQLVQHLSWNDLVRIRLTKIDLPKTVPGLIHRESLTVWCIDLTKDIREIFLDMHHKTRQIIHKAEKIMDDIQIIMNEKVAYEDLFKMHNDFISLKRHTRLLSKNRFAEYSRVADVFVLYFKRRPICGHLWIPDYSLKRVTGIFSVSCRLNSQEDGRLSGMLNRYLHWHEIQTYKTMGMELYDFGGIALSVTGALTGFKMFFGGFPIQEYCYVFCGMSCGLGSIGYRYFLKLLRVASFMQSKKR